MSSSSPQPVPSFATPTYNPPMLQAQTLPPPPIPSSPSLSATSSSNPSGTPVPPPLSELCFDVILSHLDTYKNLSDTLPVELKERMFNHFTARIPNSSTASPFSITSYPEDRYRDVQLVNRITCQRVIPLCFAMWSSLDYRYEKVKRLIEEEACDVNESDLEGFCPLHYAAIYGRIEACKLLLMHGADCTRRNNFGKTPADLAQDPRVQNMIKLRAALFRKDEVKEMEHDLQVKRRLNSLVQREQLRDEFLKESLRISDVLAGRERQRGHGSKPSINKLSISGV